DAAHDEWKLMPRRAGLNHIAIAWPDRESWLRQVAFLQAKGMPFHRRINHGMTHSVYISDPDGHGIEVLYELPREVWEHDIDAAQNYSEQLPTEGTEALVDRTDNPVFGAAEPRRARAVIAPPISSPRPPRSPRSGRRGAAGTCGSAGPWPPARSGRRRSHARFPRAARDDS